jgi:predicted DCC family thiol-disulfide oxidoreductase YuxK
VARVIDVVYDGLCRLCIRSLRVVRALDRRGVLVFHDANERQRVLDRFPQLRDADLDDAMYAVDDAGRVYRGFYAFRRVFRALPLTRWLVPVLYLPGASSVGQRVYELVARNRSRIGCRVDQESVTDG